MIMDQHTGESSAETSDDGKTNTESSISAFTPTSTSTLASNKSPVSTRVSRTMAHRRSILMANRQVSSITPSMQHLSKINSTNTIRKNPDNGASDAFLLSEEQIRSSSPSTSCTFVPPNTAVEMFVPFSAHNNNCSEYSTAVANLSTSTSSSLLQTASLAAKRKHNSFDLGRSSPLSSITSLASQNEVNNSSPAGSGGACRILPTFVSNVPEAINNAPTPRLLGDTMEFATPIHQAKKVGQSRPNSPSNCARPVPSRSRIASIRRESDCSGENEAAHEKLVKTAQQVSLGFEDFCLDEKLFEERKRAKSLTEPISILTNAFLSQSSTPSPTRSVDTQKQCYSPSTQQVVRNNIPYSLSPSPTPSSPTRSRIMRSMSPIAVRQISKRRYTGSNSGSGLESDGENSLGGGSFPAKRQCTTPRGAASPLVRDSLSGINIACLEGSMSVQEQINSSAFTDMNRNLLSYSTSPLSVSQQNATNFSVSIGTKTSQFLDASFGRQL